MLCGSHLYCSESRKSPMRSEPHDLPLSLTILQVSLATVSCKQALSCKMSLLGILAIVASIMWVATGIYILMMPKNARGQPANSTTTVTHIPAKARAAPKEQARIEQRTEARYNPDGSTSQVMVTTTTKADGTQLVTEAPLQN